MRFFYSDRPAYLLVITCRFLLCLTKTEIVDRKTYYTQTCVKLWDNLYTTNKSSFEKIMSTAWSLLLNVVTQTPYFNIELCGGTSQLTR